MKNPKMNLWDFCGRYIIRVRVKIKKKNVFRVIADFLLWRAVVIGYLPLNLSS